MSVWDELLRIVVPATVAYGTNRALANQSPTVQGLGTAAAGLGTNALLQRLGLPSTTLPGVGSSLQSSTGLNPQQLLGGLGVLGGTLLDKEPGEAVEARQYLRNLFTSPDAIANRFGTNLTGIQSQFDPFFQQQEQQALDEAQQRIIAGMPNSLSPQIGGGETAAIRDMLSRELIPRRQAFYGGLGLNFLDSQQQAAGKILDTSKPDPTAAALAQLGAILALTGGGGGQAGGAGVPGVGTQAGPGGIQFPGGGTAPTGLQDLLRGQLDPQALSQLLGFGTGGTTGTPFLFRTASGEMIPIGIDEAQALAQQGYGSSITAAPGAGTGAGAAATGVDFGVAGPGLLGPAGVGSTSALLSSAASGGAGYLVGQALGSRVEQGGTERKITQALTGFLPGLTGNEQIQATSTGAAGGALAGFAVGGPVGAVIGAIAGGIGGLTGERTVRHERKESQRLAEAQSTEQRRPVALQGIEFLKSGAPLGDRLEALRPTLDRAMIPLLQSGDAGLRERVTAIESVITGWYGRPVSMGPNDNAMAWLGWVRENIPPADGGSIWRQNDHPESNWGLLQSSETGKFNFAYDWLVNDVKRAEQLYPMVEDLIQYVTARGGA